MFSFVLNGKKVIANKNMYLIDYLRDVLHITSIKKGCDDGSCGACILIIDGKIEKSCHIKLSQIVDKNVTTIEGLSDREKDVYTYAFKSMGAVQCGYCTPSMVMIAKALLDDIELPSKAQIKRAIGDTICRCTGYIKIQEAIELSAKILKDDKQIQKIKSKGKIGEKLALDELDSKILGKTKYTDDLYMQDMVYAKTLRLDTMRALINGINYDKARLHKDFIAVIDESSLKKEKFIGNLRDIPVFVGIGQETRCTCDAICTVAGRTKESLDDILSLIEVDYEELTPITDIYKSMKEKSYKIHKDGNILDSIYIKRGDAKKAIKASKYVVTNEYSIPFTDHAFLETESALCYKNGKDLIIHASMQTDTDIKKQIKDIISIEDAQVKLVLGSIGGSFGGKIDATVVHHCALMAFEIDKPVKMTFTRKESISYHNKRDAMDIQLTTACDESGKLTAIKATILSDVGAYVASGAKSVERACIHIVGPYNYKNVDISGYSLFTNNIPSATSRGYGVIQANFAIESNINALSEMVGVSAWEMRYKNAVDVGDVLPNGQIADSDTALKETLLSVKDFFYSNTYVGVACGMKGTSFGIGKSNIGKCALVVKDDKVILKVDISKSGQGIETALVQIVCETTGLLPEQIEFESYTFDEEISSRHTFFIGEAVRQASLKLAKSLEKSNLKKLNKKYFLGEYESTKYETHEDVGANEFYAYATHCVALDEDGKIKKILASHDVGKAINPINIEGQIQGGVAMAIGYATSERLPMKDGIIDGDYKSLCVINAIDMPEVEAIIVEKNMSKLAYGAKGVAEISVIPTISAIQGAYTKFDGIFRTKLPLEDTAYNKKKLKKQINKMNVKRIKKLCSINSDK